MNGRSALNIDPQVLAAYRAERADGTRPPNALEVARNRVRGEQLEYPWLAGFGDYPTDRVSGNVDGFEITVRTVADDESQLGEDDVTGTFTFTRESVCLRNTHRDWSADAPWYRPSNYDLEYADGSDAPKGMSKQARREWAAERMKQAMRDDASRSYYGVSVTVRLEGREMGRASLWGIDGSDGSYFREVAEDVIADALAEARTERKAELDRLGHWAEDEGYPVADWQAEVAADDTRLGYRQWVENQQLLAAEVQERLEYLRREIRAERISTSEIAELQSLAEHITPGDVELLEWAGVPEFPEEDSD